MKHATARLLLPLVLALPAAHLPAQPRPPALIAHEWGTFTSLQDEDGKAVGGINTDDEPVPRFVHRLADFLLLRPTEAPAIFFQGAPRCHPDVTLRLETPVLYFHPAPGRPTAQGVSVTAAFRGGWLSEFYPNADAKAPGVQSNAMVFGPLRSSTVSTLAWKHLEIGGDWSGPATTQHVWTSPRAVRAAAVRTPEGEAERFLFYRGVAHLDAPLAVVRSANGEELALRNQCAPEISRHGPLKVQSLWLVDIDPRGRVAFRALPSVDLAAKDPRLGTVSSRFAASDYSENNRAKLKTMLQSVLVAEGLFDDEAQALLNTWELSYFKSAGMRVFFMVPRAWTDFYLPLKISAPADLTRVMVGRIELVTPEQRNNLRLISQVSTNELIPDAVRFRDSFYGRIAANPEALGRVNEGSQSLAGYGVSTPKSYQWYLDLGRFRNALILDEARRHPTPGLEGFISTYRLEGYKPGEVTAATPTTAEPTAVAEITQ